MLCKAYTTRVGSGPFPTKDEGLSEYLHGLGREFGATNYAQLPDRAKAELDRLAVLCDAPIAFVGVGPDRVQTLVVS